MAISFTDVTTERPLRQTTKPTLTRVEPGELLSLHLQAQTVRVVSGCAWITWEGEDILLTTGQEKQFTSSNYPALISAEQKISLYLEIVPSLPGYPYAADVAV